VKNLTGVMVVFTSAPPHRCGVAMQQAVEQHDRRGLDRWAAGRADGGEVVMKRDYSATR